MVDEVFLKQYVMDNYGRSADIALLSGSRAVGLGSSTSDFDIILIGSSFGKNSINSFKSDFIGDQLIEILFLDYRVLKLAKEDIQKGNYFALSYDRLRLIGRLASAVPIFNKKSWDDVFPSYLRQNYTQSMCDYQMRLSNAEFDDFLGAYEDGDFLQCAYSLRAFIGTEMMALVCKHGELLCKPKWMCKQVERNVYLDQKIKNRFFYLYFNCDVENVSRTKSWIEKTILLHQIISFEYWLGSKSVTLNYKEENTVNYDKYYYCQKNCIFNISKTIGNDYILKTKKEVMVMDRISAEILLFLSTPRCASEIVAFIESVFQGKNSGSEIDPEIELKKLMELELVKLAS